MLQEQGECKGKGTGGWKEKRDAGTVQDRCQEMIVKEKGTEMQTQIEQVEERKHKCKKTETDGQEVRVTQSGR